MLKGMLATFYGISNNLLRNMVNFQQKKMLRLIKFQVSKYHYNLKKSFANFHEVTACFGEFRKIVRKKHDVFLIYYKRVIYIKKIVLPTC